MILNTRLKLQYKCLQSHIAVWEDGAVMHIKNVIKVYPKNICDYIVINI